MNIIRIVYDWPDENNITEGLAPAPYELSLAQANLGHKIFVLCGNLNGKNLKAGRFVYTLADGAITVYNLPRALNPFGPFITSSLAVLPYYFYLKFKYQIDYIHNHGQMGVWFLLYKWVFGALDNTPVLGHFHITAKGREENLIKSGIKIPFLTKLFEYNLHKFSDWLMPKVSTNLVAVAGNVKAELIRFFNVKADKVHVLESGVDTNRFAKEGELVDFGFDPSSKYLLNIGRLSKRKNIHVIVESLNHLPSNYKLILCGIWDQAYEKEVNELISKFDLHDRVKFLGKISYFDTDKYYRSAGIFVLPSTYEGLPKVVIEALASGCKCVASGFEMEQTVPNLKFLDEISPKKLAEAIIEIDEKPSDYGKTRQIIEANYSWKSRAEKLEDIYYGD